MVTPAADEDPFLRFWAAYVARRRSEASPSSSHDKYPADDGNLHGQGSG